MRPAGGSNGEQHRGNASEQHRGNAGEQHRGNASEQHRGNASEQHRGNAGELHRGNAGVGGGNNNMGGEQELATAVLDVQQKRFYVDVKQNYRGRFIKLAEIGIGGRKNRIILPLSAAVQFRDHLNSFVRFFDGLASGEEQAEAAERGQLRSEVILHDSRRYFLDLKENQRGRYLRVSQMVSRGDPQLRSQIAIPAAGMANLRDKLTIFIDKFGEGYLEDPNNDVNLPESKYIRAQHNKFFYFDAGQNARGTFVRITEVKQVTGMRSSITVPLSSWAAFHSTIGELIEKMDAITAAAPPAEGGEMNVKTEVKTEGTTNTTAA